MSAPVALFPWGDVIEDFLRPIGLDLEDFATRMTGGWLFGYVAALQSAGRRVVIVCASDSVKAPERRVHVGTGAPIWAVPGRGVDAALPWNSWRRSVFQWRSTPWEGFAGVLRKEGCGVMLVQDYEHARFDALTLLGARRRVPVFATFQGGDVTPSRLEGRARRWSLRRCRGLVVASARERARLSSTYAGLPLRVEDVPNPIDTGEWRPSCRAQARASLGLSAEDFTVVSHGRIDIRQKGLDVLVEAWRRFSAERPGARLLLVGSGRDREAFRDLLAASGAAGVIWHDEYLTDRPGLRTWLSAADAYVIASRSEGMPVAPLEAMACGLPVVSTRAHGLPDILAGGERSGGVLVPCEDAAALADALGRLADSPDLRARLARAARARVEARFSVAAVGHALDGFLAEGRV